MIFAYMGMGIITGLASAIAVLCAGHNLPEAFLAYSLCGICTTLLVAYKTAQSLREDRDFN